MKGTLCGKMASEEKAEEAHENVLRRDDKGTSLFLKSKLGEGGLLSSELQAARIGGEQDLERQRNGVEQSLEDRYAALDEAKEREQMKHLSTKKARKYKRRHHPSKEGREMKMGIAFGAFWNGRGEDELGANLRAYGPGVSFYFKWLKWMMLVFFLLSLLQIPIFILNLGGAGFFNFLASPLSSLSIGNLFTEEFFAVDVAELTNETFASPQATSQGPAQLALRAGFLCSLLGLSPVSNVSNGCFVDQETLLVFYSSWDAVCMLLFMLMTWLTLHYAAQETSAFQDETKVLKVEDYSVEVIVPATTTVAMLRAHFERVSKDQVFEVNIVDTGGKLIEVALAEDDLRKELLLLYGRARGQRMLSARQLEREIQLREAAEGGSCCRRLCARIRLYFLTHCRCSIFAPCRRYFVQRRIERVKKKLEKVHPRVEVQWLRVLGESGAIAGSTGESVEGSDTELKESIRGKTKKEKPTHFVSAYVTFYNLEVKKKVLKLYKRRIFSTLRSQKEYLRLEREFPIVVTDPPPPNTLLWENMGYSKTQKRVRACCAFLSVFVLFCITAAISLYLESFQDFVIDLDALPSLDGLSTSINVVCNGAFLNAGDANDVETVIASQPGVLPCLCDQVLLGLITEQSIQNDLQLPGASCSDYANGKTQTLLIQFGATMATLVVNIFIFFVLEVSANFMKFTSVLQREMTIMSRIFILTLINSAIVVLLVNGNFQIDVDLILIGNGPYADFSTGWYEIVGFTIVLVATLNIVAPHTYHLIVAFYEKIINNDLVRRSRAFDQTQFNTLMLGPDFRLSIRYAQILAMMFLVLMYSSGLPIMYPIMFISLLVTYTMDKFMFLKICRRPPAYTTRFGEWSIYMLENAVLLHVIVAVWTFTSPRLFPRTFRESAIAIVESLQQRFGDEAAASLESILQSTGEDPTGIEGSIERFTSPQALPLLVVAAVVILVKIFRVFEATRKAARIVKLWVVVFLITPTSKFWKRRVAPCLSRMFLALAELYENNKDFCKPKSISLWRAGNPDDESDGEGSEGYDSSDDDSDLSSGFDSDSDSDDDIEEGDNAETIALKRAARKRRREDRAIRREARRVVKKEMQEAKQKAKDERRRLRLEAKEKRRAAREQRRQAKEEKRQAKEERVRQKIEDKVKRKEAALEAKRLKEEEKERKQKEKEEKAAAKIREKQEKIEAAKKQKEEAAQAKAAKAEAKRLAVEESKALKLQKAEEKERARLEAIEAKEAKARAKVEAREAKVQEKERKKQDAEQAKLDKEREKREAVEAKERKKVEAEEAKERKKVEAEEAKERKQREAEEAKEAKLRAKIVAKETKEQEKRK